MCRLRNIALESVTEKCDRRTDRQTDDGQSDPYVLLCFAGDTKTGCPQIAFRGHDKLKEREVERKTAVVSKHENSNLHSFKRSKNVNC